MKTRLSGLNRRRKQIPGWLPKPLRGFLGQRGQHGSAIVETAFVLPVFFILLMGFCQYAFALVSYMSATYAARAGARYASLHSLSSASPATQAQIQAFIQSNMFLPGAVGNSTILVYYGNRAGSTAGAGNYQGDLVGIGVIWNQAINIPFIPPKTYTVVTEAYRVIQR